MRKVYPTLLGLALVAGCNGGGDPAASGDASGTGSGLGSDGSDDPSAAETTGVDDGCAQIDCPDGEACDPETLTCECAQGSHRCDGECVDSTAVEHCGAACSPCTDDPNGEATCEAGVCGLVCDEGFESCDDGCCGVDTGMIALGDNIVSPSIAIDSNDTPHVCFLVDSYQLMYGYLGSRGWEVMPIGEDGRNGNEYACAIAIDADDQPIVAYEANWSIRIARPGPEAWTYETIFYSAFGYGPSISPRAIAVDAAGQPSVVLQQLDGGSNETRIRYVWDDGSEWANRVVSESHDNRYSRPSIAIDEVGVVHAAWTSFFDKGLHYATGNESDWTTEMVMSNARCCDNAVLTLDGAAAPYVAFQSDDDAYALADGTVQPWTHEPVHTPMALVGDVAIDTAGDLHYSLATRNGDVLLGRPSGRAWMESTVATEATQFMMTLDSIDAAHVVFATEASLQYAYVPAR